MAGFKYVALDKKGNRHTGNIDAKDHSEAVSLLGKDELVPVSIKKQGGFDPNNIKIPFLSSKKIKSKDLVVFTRQLSTMVSAGVPLLRSLTTLKDQAESDALKDKLTELAKDVESGLSLSEAMAKQIDVFSDIYVNMVAAGESGGILDDVLKRLAMQQEKDASIRKKVKSASVYPAVLVVITMGAFFGLMLFVVPSIGQLLIDLGGEDAQMPTQTKIMLAISNFIVTIWYLLVGGLIGFIYWFRRYIKTDKGKLKFHKLLLKTPILKTIISKVAIARFSRIFASLMGAGVGVLNTLEVTSKAIGNKVIENELVKAAEKVKNGEPLSAALEDSKVFPPIVPQMIAVGEETGTIDTVLVKVADFYEEEVDALIDSISSIIEPVMIVVLGGMVGLIALSVIGPITSISQNLMGQ